MIVARQKKTENIIEYILYMWQIEDMIRANHLDIKLIDQHIISKYQQDADTILEIRDWWDNLTEMMRLEKKESSGHLQVNINIVNDVNQVHLMLLQTPLEAAYRNAFQMAIPMIREFEMKSAAPFENDIELCLTAIYTAYLLKLQNKEISIGTSTAIKVFSKFLALLAVRYKKEQEGDEVAH